MQEIPELQHTFTAFEFSDDVDSMDADELRQHVAAFKEANEDGQKAYTELDTAFSELSTAYTELAEEHEELISLSEGIKAHFVAQVTPAMSLLDEEQVDAKFTLGELVEMAEDVDAAETDAEAEEVEADGEDGEDDETVEADVEGADGGETEFSRRSRAPDMTNRSPETEESESREAAKARLGARIPGLFD